MVEEFCKPIVDEGAFRRFVETFEDTSGELYGLTLVHIIFRKPSLCGAQV